MITPKLIIIAGPNGAGKSTLSSDIVAKYGITAFDFDKEYYEQWARFSYDPAVQKGCKEYVADKFETSIVSAFETKSNFSFETNYHTKDILNYLDLADQYGYEKNLIFIGLKSATLAKERVALRVSKNGHNVPNQEIDFRYKNGLTLLDNSFDRYNNIIISESYPDFKSENCIGIQGEKGYLVKQPSYMKSLPRLTSHITGLEQSKSIRFSF